MPLRFKDDRVIQPGILFLTRFLFTLVFAYALVAICVLLVAERLIFQPPRPSYTNGSVPFHNIALPTGDSLAVLHLPHPDAKYTILYSHGNAEDLGHAYPLLRTLRGLGFAVLAYDYRGYGRSGGGPASSRKAIEDVEAVYRYATTGLRIPGERLIVYGTSVGSGPAVELAARHQPAGLILQSAFTSTFRVITRVPLFPFDRFPNLQRLEHVRSPLLVIHGTRDHVVPFSHGRQLFAAAAEPKRSLWVEGAGHNDLFAVAGEDYATALAEFLEVVDRHGPEHTGRLPSHADTGSHTSRDPLADGRR